MASTTETPGRFHIRVCTVEATTEAERPMVNVPEKQSRSRRTPARRREIQTARTKREILDAGIRVLAVYGFSEATIDLIAQAAEISAASVYWHFGNREGVMVALAAHIGDHYFHRVHERVPETAPPDARVRGYVAALLELAHESPEVIRAHIALNTEGTTMPSLRGEIRPQGRELRAPFVSTVNQGVAAGDFRPVSGSTWMDFLMGAVKGAVIQTGLRREGYDNSDLLRRVEEAALMLLGLDPMDQPSPN